MAKSEWDNLPPPICPSCQRETLRFIGRLCPQCAKGIPDMLVAHITEIGLHAVIVGDATVRVTLFEFGIQFKHPIYLNFSADQGIIFYQLARQAERPFFEWLETDLKNWATSKGLGWATNSKRGG